MKVVKEWKTARYMISAAGLVLGLAAAMLIFGMYEGGRAVLREQFWNEGVRVYDISTEGEGAGGDGNLVREDGRLLTDKMPEAKDSMPVLKLEAQLKSYKASGSSAVLAVNQNYINYANLEVMKGSFINEQDVKNANKLVLLDDISALELYGTTDIVGQKLDMKVNGKSIEFIVSGVFKNFNKNIETVFDDEYPSLCLIPESVPEDAGFDYSIEKIVVMVDRKLHKETTAAKLSHILEKEHDAAGVYNVEEYTQLYEVSRFTDKYMVFSVILSLVGLITGGIGVMNATLLSIQERKKEIGLYKFYGSGIKELQYDIVFRTLIICLGFGMLGMAAGILAGSFIGSFLNISVRVTILSIVITIAAAAFTGIISSIYPAFRIKLVDASDSIWGEQTV